MDLIGRLVIGLVASGGVAVLAWRRHWLSASGAAGAVGVGTLVVVGGGLTWGILLLVFFMLSSLLSRQRRDRAPAIAPAKGATRDLGQVLANGGVVALLAALAIAWPASWMAVAALGALAAVTADTWASEIGAHSTTPPRLVTTGRIVPAGSNGGVTPLGLLASVAGGLTIGVVGWALAPVAAALGGVTTPAATVPWLPLVGAVAGVGGSLVDSILGATVQGVRWCPACALESEASVHRCGARTAPLRGWRWLDNDHVNLVAALTGSVLAVSLGLLLTGRGS
ncbi:MAG: DUF92 domain-containing protein [Chloroflexi bacterium]|nr:DUF92 domain-containing protein [Chloroflexota bacterium]